MDNIEYHYISIAENSRNNALNFHLFHDNSNDCKDPMFNEV